jgi:hypothetical protein
VLFRLLAGERDLKAKTLKILFAGHSGISKTASLESLRTAILHHKPDLNVDIIDAEEGIEDMPLFLGQDLEPKKDKWQRAVANAIEAWKQEDPVPDVTLLSVHLSYLWQSHLSSPMSWPISFKDGPHQSFFAFLHEHFRPDCVIVLIDDIQAVLHRIRKKRYEFRLREIMHWRDTETLLADLLASHIAKQNNSHLYPHENSAVIAVRHSPEMLYRYLFERGRERIYASFPISAPRSILDPAERKVACDEIDGFRQGLAEHFTVFDPLTIDEFPIAIKYQSLGSQPAARAVELSVEDQWQIPAENTLCKEVRTAISLEVSQMAEISLKIGAEGRSEIARQTHIRDHRLIDQSDMVVIYRPTLRSDDGEWSHGTLNEAEYAQRRSKPFIVIRDPKNDPTLAAKTLGIELTPASTLDHLGDLHVPKNQAKLIQELISRIKERCEPVLPKREHG